MWQCVGNVLRSHAAAVQLFRQLVPKGAISMALNSDWCEPLTSSAADQVHATGMQLCRLPCVYQPVLTPSLWHAGGSSTADGCAQCPAMLPAKRLSRARRKEMPLMQDMRRHACEKRDVCFGRLPN